MKRPLARPIPRKPGAPLPAKPVPRWNPPKKTASGQTSNRAAILQIFLAPGHAIPLRAIVRTASPNGFISHEIARKMLNGFLTKNNWVRKVGLGAHTKYVLTPNAVTEVRKWIEQTGITPGNLDARFIESGFDVKTLEPSGPAFSNSGQGKSRGAAGPLGPKEQRRRELKTVLSSVRKGKSTPAEIAAKTGLPSETVARSLQELERLKYLIPGETAGQKSYRFNEAVLRPGIIGGPVEKRHWFGRDLRGDAGRMWNAFLLRKLENLKEEQRTPRELARLVGRGLSEQRIKSDLERMQRLGLVVASGKPENPVFSPAKKSKKQSKQ